MIPKIIHYCWFGGGKKTKLVKSCISSWKKNLEDYKIIEWNENNTDLSHPFVKEAYLQKKWAFVSDYIRLIKIEELGGIYLDTDFVVVKKFDELLNQDCFFGAENEVYIAAGLFGAKPNHKFIKLCKEKYNGLNFANELNLEHIAIPMIITQEFREINNFEKKFNSIVSKNGVKIYPSPYFYPLPSKDKKYFSSYKKYLKKESYAVHLWAGSWMEYSEFENIRNRQYKKGLDEIWRNFKSGNFSFKYVRKVMSAFKESLM